jgi:16S rRNA (guanine527-N7)-methyltransferase
MEPTRIAELLQPFLQKATDQRLPPNNALYRNISTYMDLLQRWNARINLTAIRDEEEIATRHFGESLFAARHLFPNENDQEGQDFRSEAAQSKRSVSTGADNAPTRKGVSASTVADLGSGAGFPGLLIKLWAPEISLTLIESNQKKAAFLREVVRALTLTDVNIQNARAEGLNPNQTFDLITLRAVERFAAVLPIAARLVAPAGRLALLIGSSQVNEAQVILPEFSWHPEIPVPCSKARTLLAGVKEP